MLKPLTQFYCDTCGEIIDSPEEGWIEWIADYNDSLSYEIHSFRIVHHFTHSPIALETNEGCYQHAGKSGRSDTGLRHFINDDYKMAYILQFLDIGSYHDPNYKGSKLTDMRQYVETVRRITTPYYEEARRYWDRAIEDGFFIDINDISIFGKHNLKRIIEIYGDK